MSTQCSLLFAIPLWSTSDVGVEDFIFIGIKKLARERVTTLEAATRPVRARFLYPIVPVQTYLYTLARQVSPEYFPFHDPSD